MHTVILGLLDQHKYLILLGSFKAKTQLKMWFRGKETICFLFECNLKLHLHFEKDAELFKQLYQKVKIKQLPVDNFGQLQVL